MKVLNTAVFLSSLTTLQAQVSLRVATYNVYNYNDGDNWEDRQNWVRDNIESVNPDFIGIQELRMDSACPSLNFWPFCNNNAYEDMVSLLEPLGYTYHEFRGAEDSGGNLEGLTFFSKFNVRRVTDADISVDLSQDGNNRIVVNIETDVPGYGVVNFFNTHWSYVSSERPNNADGVAAFIRETAANQDGQSNDFTYFVLGDTNTNSGSMEGLFNEDLPYVYGGSTARLVNTYGGGGARNTYCNCKLDGSSCSLTGRLDHVMVQNVAAVTVDGHGTVTHPDYPSVCPSDHRLYYADITLS